MCRVHISDSVEIKFKPFILLACKMLQAEYIVTRLQDAAQNLRRTVEQFDLLFSGEITEEQATRHGLFIEHPPLTVDWDALTADNAIVSHLFFVAINF